MTQNELLLKLKRLGIPPHHYDITGEGHSDNAVCLEKSDDLWEVYFWEKGTKCSRITFTSQELAFDEIFRRFR